MMNNKWLVYEWAKKNMPEANIKAALKAFPQFTVEEVMRGLAEYDDLSQATKERYYQDYNFSLENLFNM
jgi:hypothetical protein